MDWYVRAPGLIAIAGSASYLFVVPGRDPIRIDGLDVEAMARVIGAAGLPIGHAELSASCDEAAIASLVDLGVLIRGTEAELAPPRAPRAARARPCKRIVVGLSGAISVTTMLGHLVAIADGFADEVDVIVSEGARRFVRPELFAYYGFRVWTDPFEPAHGFTVPHSHLAAAAELVLVAPASASMLHKLATGACSDLISLVVAATAAPVVVAPSTNPAMWRHPPVQRNVAQLRADGRWVVEPQAGARLSNPDELGVGVLGLHPDGLVTALEHVLRAARGDHDSSSARSHAGSTSA